MPARLAEGLTRMELSRRLGCKESELVDRGWKIMSAGAMALGGSPATPEAIEAARRLGADIRRHENRPLTAGLIDSSDLVFCMAGHHVEAVVRLSPTAAGRVRLLDTAGDVPDPMGCPAEVYHQAAKQIHLAIQARMDEILN